MHHNKKVDAPSGTALLLGRAAAEGRGIDLDRRSVRGRDGITGARNAGDIGFAALRGGTVVGEHSVIFAGPAERIELTHKAEDRMIFARGALHAALWARDAEAGALFDDGRARAEEFLGGDMTAEQAARLKGRSYALIGAGIAGLVAAYQFATTQSPEGPWSPVMPFLFGGAGFILIAIGAYLLTKAMKANVEPSGAIDLKNPQGKAALVLFVIGFAALVGAYFLDYGVPPGQALNLALTAGLYLVVAVCFISATRIARKIRAATGTSK